MDWITLFFAVTISLTLIIALIHFVNWLASTVGGKSSLSRDLDKKLERIADMAERTEKSVRDEHQRMRKDAEENARELRKEVGDGILKFGGNVQTTMSESRTSVDKRFVCKC